MTNDIDARLQEIFVAVLQLPAGAEVARVEQDNEPKWDSLAHVTLMAALESEFGITIDIGQSLELTSFAAVRRLLKGNNEPTHPGRGSGEVP